MKTFWIVLLIVVLAGLIGGGWFWFKSKPASNGSYEYTSKKGEKVLVNIKKGQKIASPLNIAGQVKGSWSFEASFPVILQDNSGNILSQEPGTLTGDWMTENLVPFEANLTFLQPKTGNGVLILKKDNPSDQRELDDSVEILVKF